MQREGLNEIVEIGFEFRKQRFVFNTQLNHVEKLKYPVKVWQMIRGSTTTPRSSGSIINMFSHGLSHTLLHTMSLICFIMTWSLDHRQETFETYAKMTGHGTEQKALIAHDKYGLNKFEVPVPPFGELLKEHLM